MNYVFSFYLTLIARCLFITTFLILFIIFCFYNNSKHTFAQFRITNMMWIEFTWTLTPFFFLESYSYIQNFFGLGRQWYWSFSSFLFSCDIYFLSMFHTSLINTFNSTFVFFRVSSEDVIHDLGVPSLNLKIDACPGRINSCIGYSHTSGLHYRTCSELCRVNHSYMPFLLI